MQKEKIYAFRGYGEYYFYNEHDLNCFWEDSLEWCGGKWIDSSIEYIVASHICHLNDKGMQAITKEEYNGILDKLKTVDNEFYNYLSECEFSNNLTTEEFFNVTVTKITIDENTRIEDYPNIEFVVDIAENDPFRVYLSDVIDNEYYGDYLIIR